MANLQKVVPLSTKLSVLSSIEKREVRTGGSAKSAQQVICLTEWAVLITEREFVTDAQRGVRGKFNSIGSVLH